ncbi:MAG TPA: helix-turn-helix domain-containing protein [Candidatus Dormibacteraeota bacterium]
MARKYELKKRAERQEETRRRITEAATELHSSVGPARTTIAAIAERAGVQRQTVYKHFPDEYALFGACTSLSWEQNPGPDPAVWRLTATGEQRLRRGLTELYGYFGANRQLLANVRRDADTMPVVRWAFSKFRAGWLADCRAALCEGWPQSASAAIGHAVDFAAWDSLENLGLDDPAKVDLMVLLAEAASKARPAPRVRASRASPSLRAAG